MEIRKSIAITTDQRARIDALGLPYGLYPSVLSCMLLAYWRWEQDGPGSVKWLTHTYEGGIQHVCKLTGAARDLYEWFRNGFGKRCTARAIVELGLSTATDWRGAGYTGAQIDTHVQGIKARLWGNPGV